MIGRSFWIQGCVIHKFKGPSPYVEGHILTPQLSPSLHHATESNVGKWAPHVCIDLDTLHTASLRRSSDSGWGVREVVTVVKRSPSNDVVGFLLFRYACLPDGRGHLSPSLKCWACPASADRLIMLLEHP